MTGQVSRVDRLQHELRQYGLIVLYLWVTFGVLLLYKSAILSEQGVTYLPFGLALGKALILGKFLMLGEAAGIGSWTGSRNLLVHIARKIVLLLVVLILLTIAEELLVGWFHGRSIAEVAHDSERQPFLELVAACLYMLLLLTPYVATQEVSRALGPGVLRGLLLGESRSGRGAAAGAARS